MFYHVPAWWKHLLVQELTSCRCLRRIRLPQQKGVRLPWFFPWNTMLTTSCSWQTSSLSNCSLRSSSYYWTAVRGVSWSCRIYVSNFKNAAYSNALGSEICRFKHNPRQLPLRNDEQPIVSEFVSICGVFESRESKLLLTNAQTMRRSSITGLCWRCERMELEIIHSFIWGWGRPDASPRCNPTVYCA